MEFKITASMSDGDHYPNEVSVSREFTLTLPWAPGDHEAETALVEATDCLVKFPELIGELHEELTQKYEAKLHQMEKSSGQPDTPQPPAEA